MEPLPPKRLQFAVFALLFAVGFLVLGLRFWQLQIQTHDHWENAAIERIAKMEKAQRERAREAEQRQRARREQEKEKTGDQP